MKKTIVVMSVLSISVMQGRVLAFEAMRRWWSGEDAEQVMMQAAYEKKQVCKEQELARLQTFEMWLKEVPARTKILNDWLSACDRPGGPYCMGQGIALPSSEEIENCSLEQLQELQERLVAEIAAEQPRLKKLESEWAIMKDDDARRAEIIFDFLTEQEQAVVRVHQKLYHELNTRYRQLCVVYLLVETRLEVLRTERAREELARARRRAVRDVGGRVGFEPMRIERGGYGG